MTNQSIQMSKHLLSAPVVMACSPLIKLLLKTFAVLERLALDNIGLGQSAVSLPAVLELGPGNVVRYVTAGAPHAADRGLVCSEKLIATSPGLQVNRLQLGLYRLYVASEGALSTALFFAQNQKESEDSSEYAATKAAAQDRDPDGEVCVHIPLFVVLTAVGRFTGGGIGIGL
jgi:hypothetical protein